MQGIPSFDGTAQSPTARHIPEDTLHYTIHLPPSLTLGTPQESLATLITAHVYSLLQPEGERWLWHKDAWQLCVVPEKDPQDRRRKFGVVVDKVAQGLDDGSSDEDAEDADSHHARKGPSAEGWGKLEGRMRIGDAVDDEWLVVWLLRCVSERWPEVIVS